MKKLLALIMALLLSVALVGGGTVFAGGATVAGATSVTSEIAKTVFGPEAYLRTAGPPNVYTDGFSIRADYDATITMGRLIVYNGEKGRSNPTRARDATIMLNGCVVLDSTDIGEAVDVIVLPVKLESDNEISVTIRGKPGSYLTIQVDYETGLTGPVFSGPQQYPFIPRTEQSSPSLGQPLVDNHAMGIPIYDVYENGTKTGVMIGYSKDGSIPTRVDYYYRTTAGKFVRLANPTDRPSDMVNTTTTEGLTVPYIVRLERGTINRFIYGLAMLAPYDDLESPWDTWDMSAWNGRLLFRFDGGVGIGHSQGTLGVSSPLYHDALSMGYAVAYSTGTVTGVHYNLVLGGETVLLVKDHFVTRYGEPEYTISIGGSGGGIQQYIYAQNHPGLLDGIIPQACYPDMHTQTIPVGDGMLLEYYFDVVAPKQGDSTFGGFNLSGWPFAMPSWMGSILPRTWIEGASSSDTVKHPVYYPMTGHLGSTEMVNGWLGLTPMCLNPLWHSVSGVNLWYPQAQVQATKWTHADDLVNIFGVDEYGYARRDWDNVGVQYGLQALKDGHITVAQFLDINARVGGWKEPHEMVQEGYPFYGPFNPFNFDPWSIRNADIAVNGYGVAPRTEGDLQAIEAAWTSGIVFLGELDDVPIIDMRQYLDPYLDMHNARQSFSVRARMIDAQGHADNQIIWVADKNAPPRNLVVEAFALLDEWITNIKANPELGVVGNKPESAVDMAYFANGTAALGPDVWDGILNNDPPGPGTIVFPPFSSPRMVAGGDIQGDIFKAYLIPVEEAIERGFYDPVVLTPAQIDRLNEIFPTGVADYSQGDVGRPEGLTRADVIRTLP
jgi:hypothetical protein